MAYKTIYKPKNIEKYVGDHTKIKCRSLWERNVCKFCDENSNIIKWSFEELPVPYMNPLDQKIHNYYPDFLIKFNVNGTTKSWMLEVKPKKQTILKENASKKEKKCILKWLKYILYAMGLASLAYHEYLHYSSL